jgi:type I restriction enzyme S subunit
MKHYDSYKDSGIEWISEIPSHWEVKRLKRMTKIKRGSSPRPIDNPKYFDENGQFSWVRISDVTKSERYLISTEERLSELGCSLSTKIYPNQLFLSIAGSVGKPIISNIECCIHDGFVWFENLNFNSELLWYQFNVGTCFSGLGKMGTQLNLNSDTVGMIHLPVPPLSEQEHIVSYLDDKTTKIDELIQNKLRKIDLLKEYRTSLINTVVTKGLNPNVPMKDSGIEWIGEIPSHWNKIKVGYISKLLTGNPWSSDKFDYDKGIKIVRGENVSEGFLRWGERTRYWIEQVEDDSNFYLTDGDIIIGMDGSKVGKNYVRIKKNDLPLLLHQRMCRVRVNDSNDSKFVEYWIGSDIFKYYIDISKTDPMIPHITQKNIFDFCVTLPPISEQEHIVSYLDEKTSQIDKTIDIEKNKIELLKEYRQSLISNVVTGKINISESV